MALSTAGAARSARTISLWVVGGLALGMLFDGAAVAHSASGLSLLDRYVAGTVTDDGLVAWDNTFALLGLLQAGVFLATALLWFAWQYRIVASIAPLGLGAPVVTPAKSILWWFVPFANFVMVYRIYQDLAQKLLRQPGFLVGAWWGVYLLGNVLTQVAGRYWLADFETIDQLNRGLWLWIASDALSVVSALIALLMVRRIQAGQDQALAAAANPAALAAPIEASLDGLAPDWLAEADQAASMR